jgi:GAF domain-containing protein
LRAIAGEINPTIDLHGHIVDIDQESIVGWVAKNKKLRVAPRTSEDPYFQLLPGTSNIESEIAIPIKIEDTVFGVMDILDHRPDAFNWDEITILQTIIDQIAASIHNFWIIENYRFDPKTSAYLFNASHRINSAKSDESVYENLATTFKRLPFHTVFYVLTSDRLQRHFITFCGESTQKKLPTYTLPVDPKNISQFLPDRFPINLSHPDKRHEFLPEQMVNFCQDLGFMDLFLFPLYIDERLLGLLFLGTDAEGSIHSNLLNAISKLFEISKQSLQKARSLQAVSEQLQDLQTLNAISQSVSTETDLNHLYEVIHQQVVKIMGNINFLIALYSETDNTIHIPYMDDGEKITSVPPFELGKGLTSIIVRTRQPLMIVEDTVTRSQALGAIITDDKPAKSWLGVPILVGENLLGAIIVQDLEEEKRFDEQDKLLLTNIASHIAVALRNSQLIESAEKQASKEHTIGEVTSRIRETLDVETIVKTASEEIRKALDLPEVTIHLGESVMEEDPRSR